MGAFETFVASDAFFPVLTGLMLALVLVFVWILLSGRKKIDKDNSASNISNNDDTNVNVLKSSQSSNGINDDSLNMQKSSSVLPSVIYESTESEEKKTPQIETNNITSEVDNNQTSQVNNNLSVDDVVVDLPIRNMDLSPVEITTPNQALNDAGESVEIEISQGLNEQNVTDDQKIDIELPAMKIEEDGEEVELPEMKTLVNENEGESIEIPNISDQFQKVGDNTLAFKSLPEEIRTINDNVIAEQPKEYVGEKTEIFDFPDFNNLEQGDEKLNNAVQDEIKKAANDYVSNVFKES